MVADGPSGDDPFAAIRAPGTYMLLLALAQPRSLTIGALGLVDLPAGWYLYVGSALGGLGPRLRRHARLDKHYHWHIDTLRAASRLVAVAWRVSPDRMECAVARDVVGWPDATLPAPRFGSSDCRCRSHLVHFPARPDLSLGPAWEVWSLPCEGQGFGPGIAGGSGVASAGTGW